MCVFQFSIIPISRLHYRCRILHYELFFIAKSSKITMSNEERRDRTGNPGTGLIRIYLLYVLHFLFFLVSRHKSMFKVFEDMFTITSITRTVSKCYLHKLTCLRSLLRILVLLLVSDVFVGHEEQNHLTLFIFNGYNVQKTPELCTWTEHTCKHTQSMRPLQANGHKI